MSEFSIRPLQSQVSIFYKTNTNTNTSILIRHITSTLMFDRSKLPSLFNIKLNRSYRKMEVKIISFWLTERFQFFCKKLSQGKTDFSRITFLLFVSSALYKYSFPPSSENDIKTLIILSWWNEMFEMFEM